MEAIRYFGNEASKIVHLGDCGYLEQADPEKVTCFSQLFDALGQEFRECRWCFGNDRESEYRQAVTENRSAAYFEAWGGSECLCCGEGRGVQRAHIVARRFGGKETMPLCPTCHWNYDHDLLSPGEEATIKSALRSRMTSTRSSKPSRVGGKSHDR